MLTRTACAGRSVLLATTVAAVASAQGTFVNFEDPQIKPITIAKVAGQRFAVLCNTADNAVEVYQADAPFAYVLRVPVGQSPVTVRWNPSTSSLYTCNWLGDSITRIDLEVAGGGLRSRTVYTEFVGDEPSDIAFLPASDPAQQECYVTLHSSGRLARHRTLDMSEVTAPQHLLVGPPGSESAVKMARRVEVLDDGRFFVLNHLGGQLVSGSPYDFGLYASTVGASTGTSLAGVGTGNFNFAFDAPRNRMFVVSQIAKTNSEPIASPNQGVLALQTLPTGFVQTWLQVVNIDPSQPTTLVRPQGAGPGPKPLYRSINLNQDYAQLGLVGLPQAQTLAQVTDVAVIADAEDLQYVVLAAFGSDRVAFLAPDGSAPSGWQVSLIDLRPTSPGGPNSNVGPRGLAYDPEGDDLVGPTGLVWVQNRIDNSFAVIDPWTKAIRHQVALQWNPTPVAITTGRRFLYSARDTSGSATVSCSSCHIDGRTDALGWKLGILHAPPNPIASQLKDTIGIGPTDEFRSNKGTMVTQTLQGLVNSQVDAPRMPPVASNAPYHWRGDKARFQDFNEAFVNLQGRSQELTEGEMNAYTLFVNTIHHPPNPEQPRERVYGGVMGDPNALDTTPDPNDPLAQPATGARYGLKLFHIARNVEGGRSCVHCHSLPEGSSNTLTERLDQEGSPTTGSGDHALEPIEAAALRNLRAREMSIPQGFDVTTVPRWTGAFGLLHAGIYTFPPGFHEEKSYTTNDFIHRTFRNFADLHFTQVGRLSAVTEFVRQFDTGVAPIVGFTATIRRNTPPATTAAHFDLLEGQARAANAGVAVHIHLQDQLTGQTTTTGYYYDPHADRYTQGTGPTVTRAQLTAPALGKWLVVQATPAGSERRVAMLIGTGGQPAPLSGPAPSNLTLLPMVPQTAFEGITTLTVNWGNLAALPVRQVRHFQENMPGSFYAPAATAPQLRNEPPRRFRIAGQDIRPGAKLVLGMATTTPRSEPVVTATFDLAPTDLFHGGLPVWETTEELDPLQTMVWLSGGYSAPGVSGLLSGSIPATPALQPLLWNGLRVQVRNEGGVASPAAPAWQTLQIQDLR